MKKAAVNKHTMPGFYLIGGKHYNSNKADSANSSQEYTRNGFLRKGRPLICADGNNRKLRRVTPRSGEGRVYRRYCDPREGRFNELKLVGLSPSNVHAYYEGTVMHGASYVPPGDAGGSVAGTSKGCPAFYEGDFERVANQIGGTEEETSLYYSYAPQCEEDQKDQGNYVNKVLEMKERVLSEKQAIQGDINNLISAEELNGFNRYLDSKNLLPKRGNRPRDFVEKSYGKKVVGFYEYVSHLNDYLNSLRNKSPNATTLSQKINTKLQIENHNEDAEVNAFKYYCDNILDQRLNTNKSTCADDKLGERCFYQETYFNKSY